jgi:hypothetical protein
MQFQADEFETVMPAKFIMYFFGILSASPDASAPVTPYEYFQTVIKFNRSN